MSVISCVADLALRLTTSKRTGHADFVRRDGAHRKQAARAVIYAGLKALYFGEMNRLCSLSREFCPVSAEHSDKLKGTL